MVGTLYLLSVAVLLLVALALTLPVIRDIVLEGLERRRKWNNDEIERYTEDEEFDAGPPAVEADETDPDRQACQHCGAVNDADYAFCAECSEPL
ncbi:DUF7577 domain-containing protein [Salinibaculum rarum]|uniref:DUF7577 domain-containing protein n=1 Tax=Salinibaculum rarum TaxID=3058903 RepID=UPI00265E4A06|nr:hypothetical protein [Salinibaculum sp. KK48]